MSLDERIARLLAGEAEHAPPLPDVDEVVRLARRRTAARTVAASALAVLVVVAAVAVLRVAVPAPTPLIQDPPVTPTPTSELEPGEVVPATWRTVTVWAASLSVPPGWRVVDLDTTELPCLVYEVPTLYLSSERYVEPCEPAGAQHDAVGLLAMPADRAPFLARALGRGQPTDVGAHTAHALDLPGGMRLVVVLGLELALEVSRAPDPELADRVVATARRAGVTAAADCPPSHPDAARALAELPVGWTELPPPPVVRARATAVWTGRELVYWGGDTEYGGVVHRDGAVYHPVSNTWCELGPAWEPRTGAHGVWTGREVVVPGTAVAGGFAFDPIERRYRRIAAAPLSEPPAAVVWTGTTVLAWGAAYDPEADEWSAVAPAPVRLSRASAVWTGREAIFYGAWFHPSTNRSTTAHAVGVAYDPGTDRWRTIAEHPISPQASTAVWTGSEVVVWDYGFEAGAYDPERDTWRELPRLPLNPGECDPQSALVDGRVFAWFCGQYALLDLATDTWEVVAPPPGEAVGQVVAAGDVVLVVGASHEGGFNSLWAYRPERRGSDPGR